MIRSMDEVLNYFLIFIVSITPGVEVRGSIPLTYILLNNGLSRFAGVLIAVAGNLIISPILLAVLNTVDSIIKNSKQIPKALRTAYINILNYVNSKSIKVRQYSLIGLLLFTAVPLPGTGAWTASFIAFLIGMNRFKAVVAIELGVLIASLLVLTATHLGLEILKAIFLLP
ncbi:MAG: small multi-drug export protein [Sulfolobales archaeon]